MKRFEKKLPDAELEVMKVIWHNNSPISTKEVKEIIDRQTDKNWTQQTLQTLLNRLISKGFLAKDKKGKEYIYTSLIEEHEYVEYENGQFLKNMHGNSVVSLMKSLFDSKKISEEDICELEKMFKEKRE